MNIIDKILTREEFKEKPPVLMDIGASGGIFPAWKKIAKHSICIAFDADNRELDYISNNNSDYMKVYIFNRIASDENVEEKEFFLTNSPFCSSTLEPDLDSLKEWNFFNKFKVRNKEVMKTIHPKKALEKIDINYIDWFKADSQGTDLILFDSLDNKITERILAADFEPGIIDAYKKEDKLHHLMNYMESKPFWMNELRILESQRLDEETKDKLASRGHKDSSQLIRGAPICGEVSYFNTLNNKELFSKRDYLLMWVLAFSKKQYGFAVKVSGMGKDKYSDPIFDELDEALNQELNMASRKRIVKTAAKKAIKKLKKLFK